LVTILALYRPGPIGSGMLDDYIKRKNKEVEVTFAHPKMVPILRPTFGVMVYQEQVMNIAKELAGFNMVQADHLRKGMGKKIPEVMKQMREDFVRGCTDQSGIDSDKANKLFDLIAYFSGYGFNKSHSTGYALIAYQTAYLKANFPLEYMCAVLSNELGNQEKEIEYVKECKRMKIQILKPDINKSDEGFCVEGTAAIRYGLEAIKNVGERAAKGIVEERCERGSYTSIFNFYDRISKKTANKKVLVSLLKSGAFDALDDNRDKLIGLVESGDIKKKGKRQEFHDLKMPAEANNKKQMDYMKMEREVLGIHLNARTHRQRDA